MTLSILADIGGTNTRVALAEGARVLPGSIARYSNTDYASRGQDIADILADYLQTAGQTVSGVCVAAAGPVQHGMATMTNLNWVMDADKLHGATQANRIAILNDLQAQGHALDHIAAANLRPVISGPKAPGAMLVVGLGTGVNAAPVHGTGAARLVPPSECGHVTMPVRGDEDLALMRFVEARLARRGEVAHCGVEEVLSGRGLANLFAFAAADAGSTTTSAQVFAALDAGDATACHAAQIYTRILGQTLADLALIHLPYGGIFLIGGMARAMAPHFAALGLTQSFREPRRVDLLETAFSVTVVEDDFAALTGCAAYLAAQTG
ncbi:MAG: ROK family protein [Rhodobacteraceae bacterium]|nr:ROK family protein [Paracoccaceae bacterium]